MKARGVVGALLVSFFVAGCGGGGGSGGGGAGLNLGKMWAVTGDGDQIELVDTATGSVQTIDAGAQTLHIAVGAGAVWASTDQNTLLRVDPTSMSIAATVKGFFDIRSIAATANSVWVADNGDGSQVPPEIRQVDPTSNSIVASFQANAVNDEYHELLAGASDLYLEIDNTYVIASIDPATATVKKTVALGKQGGYGYGELALDGNFVWTADQYSHVLHELTTSPLAAKTEFPIDARFDGTMAAGDGSVFLGDSNANSVGFFDPSSGSLKREINAGAHVTQMALRNNVLVVAEDYTGNGVVLLIDPKTGKQLGKLQGVYAREFAFE